MTQKTDFNFFHRLRVRWAEVDLQRVVFNGNYLLYFDVAFTEYWRATGLRDPIGQQKEGVELFVRKAQIEYHGSAGFDDVLEIGVRCAKLGRSSMTITIAIFRGDEHLIDGELIYVYANAHEKEIGGDSGDLAGADWWHGTRYTDSIGAPCRDHESIQRGRGKPLLQHIKRPPSSRHPRKGCAHSQSRSRVRRGK